MLKNILKDYNFDLFKKKHIIKLERLIKKTNKYPNYIYCLIRNKKIKLTPEEIIRQLYIIVLLDDYDYNKSDIKVEFNVVFGKDTTKRADIAVFDKNGIIKLIVEVKNPSIKLNENCINQLKSYCLGTGAPIGILSNGRDILILKREGSIFKEISYIPNINQNADKNKGRFKRILIKIHSYYEIFFLCLLSFLGSINKDNSLNLLFFYSPALMYYLKNKNSKFFYIFFILSFIIVANFFIYFIDANKFQDVFKKDITKPFCYIFSFILNLNLLKNKATH